MNSFSSTAVGLYYVYLYKIDLLNYFFIVGVLPFEGIGKGGCKFMIPHYDLSIVETYSQN